MDLKLSGRRVVDHGRLERDRARPARGSSCMRDARWCWWRATPSGCRGCAAGLGAGNRVATCAADLSQGAERERVAAALADIDILVNNAGAIPGGGLLDLAMERWEEAWALKVMGYIHLTQLYLAGMKQRQAGVIVNIIGGAGRSPRYDYVCGGTGNAALMAFTSAVGGQIRRLGRAGDGHQPLSNPHRPDRLAQPDAGEGGAGRRIALAGDADRPAARTG